MSLLEPTGFSSKQALITASHATMFSLHAITPFTMLDYPDELACVAWFSGCNMRCVYCHNPDIVLARGGDRNESDLLDFLEKRREVLTAVVFSGGEATLCEKLPELARKAKDLGYKVKLDTNGTRPEVISQMWKAGTLDYVALDYKTTPERAEALIGTAKFHDTICDSLDRLIGYAENGLKFEVRTTFHSSLMTIEDLAWIIEDLGERGYRGTYYIQNIRSYGEKTLGNIVKPEGKLAVEQLAKPQGFNVALRNFSPPYQPSH